MTRMLMTTALMAAVLSTGCTAIAKEDVPAHARTVDTEAGPMAVEPIATGLSFPWGLDFLPDGRMLVTELPGSLRIVGRDGTLSQPVQGVPEVFHTDQGGLLDVRVDPNFAETRLVYLSFAEPGENGTAGTAVARGRLEDGRLADVEVIFRQQPKVEGPNHFGSRLAFTPDGLLFIGLGERFKFEPAQDLSSHLGKVIRIQSDGGVPPGNPFVNQQNALPEIWSYGHRNIQGAAIHPETGQLWINEHGPKGGDEVNIPEPGRNYGWPVVSWGNHYDGGTIPDPPTRPEFARSIHQWTPVIAASGMDFYTGDRVADWQGDLFNGGLVSKGLVRLELDGQTVTHEERIPLGQRIRQVQEGPDGALYILTDEESGEILRMAPAAR